MVSVSNNVARESLDLIPFESLYPGTSRVWSQFSTRHRRWGVWRHNLAHCVWRGRKSQNKVPAVVFFFISTGQTKLLCVFISPVCCCYFLLEMTVPVMFKCLNTKKLRSNKVPLCYISTGLRSYKLHYLTLIPLKVPAGVFNYSVWLDLCSVRWWAQLFWGFKHRQSEPIFSRMWSTCSWVSCPFHWGWPGS